MSMLKILRTSRTLAVAAACIGIFTLGIQQAQATTLDLLFLGGTITANDKLFDNFLIIDNPQGLNVGLIDVTPLTDGGLDPGPGLRYVGNGGLRTVGGPADFAFSFRVSTNPSEFLIKDNSLTLTDTFFDVQFFGAISITELVDDNNPPVAPDLASKLVFDFDSGGGHSLLHPPTFRHSQKFS